MCLRVKHTFGNLESQDCITVRICTKCINRTQGASSIFNEVEQVNCVNVLLTKLEMVAERDFANKPYYESG